MTPIVVFEVIGIAAVIVVAAAIGLPYLVSSRRNRKFGTHGFVQHSRLTCPKCHGVFDYSWYPGMAFTAVRLGPGRYMACPLCDHWSYFRIWDAPPPPSTPAT